MVAPVSRNFSAYPPDPPPRARAGDAARPADGKGPQLTSEQREQLAKLQRTDQQVRAHELAHLAAGAGITGGAHYELTTGPDGKAYAVAGEVAIDTSPGKSPAETLAKARQIRSAALAPAEPSGADRAVAAKAAAMAAEAQQQLSAQRQEASTSAGQAAGEAPAGVPRAWPHAAAQAYREAATLIASSMPPFTLRG